MLTKEFSLSHYSPAIQKMCGLDYDDHFYDGTAEQVDYIERFSLTENDIPHLLEIAGWAGQDEDADECWKAAFHAWKALSLFEPMLVVPQMLDLLNHINWDETDEGFFQDVLADTGKRSAKEAQESGNAALNTVPLFLDALKEKDRHSRTRTVLSGVVCSLSFELPEFYAVYHQVLLDDLKELRIDCRSWYATVVSELASEENPSPELVALINKVCREGYAETCQYWEDDALVENLKFDFENDVELLALNDKSEEACDVLLDFQSCENEFPYDAVQKARELRDWIIPNLIEVVRDATVYARFHVTNGTGTIQFAVHLLAEFQAKEALPAIFDSLSLTSDEAWDYLYDDGLFEAMPGILNRLTGDELDFYDQRLRDPQTPETLRCCLSAALRFLVARKTVSVETYGSLLRDYLEIAIQTGEVEYVTSLVCDILDTGNPENIPLVRSAFEKKLITEGMISLEYAEEELTKRSISIWEMLPDPDRDFSDAVEELSSWAWFQEDSYRPEQPKTAPPQRIDLSQAVFGNVPRTTTRISFPENDFTESDFWEDEYDDSASELSQTGQKIGRNEPCPCGSGKKYKVCCLKKT